jgi:DDE family transposase
VGRHRDGTWLALLGTVRVIDAEITVTTSDGTPHHTGHYRLITTLTDHRRFPALDLIAVYHQRWEIETAFLELKSTTLGGRVVRARTPAGIDQEVYALLTAYQTIRLAMTDATDSDPTTRPDRASFTIALNTARDQVIHAAAAIAGNVIDLVGTIGRTVLNDLLPGRRTRISPRVVNEQSPNTAPKALSTAPTTKPPSPSRPA